jgi:hypothetical protein
MSSHWRLLDPKATLAGDCFGGAKVPRPEVATKDEYTTAPLSAN